MGIKKIKELCVISLDNIVLEKKDCVCFLKRNDCVCGSGYGRQAAKSFILRIFKMESNST